MRQSTLQTTEVLLEVTRWGGHPQALIQEMAEIEAVTPSDIQRVAQRYLCDQPLNRLITLKTGEAVQPTHPGPLVQPLPDAGARSKGETVLPQPPRLQLPAAAIAQLPAGVVRRDGPPQSLPVRPTQLPPYHTFRLQNGLKAIVVEQHDLPTVSTTLWIGGSDVATPAHQRGLALLLTQTITQGTATASAVELAEQVESLGGSMEAQAHLEYSSLNLEAPSTELTTTVDVLADITRQPTFPAAAVEVAQARILAQLQTEATDPDALAQRQFYQLAYPNHPYGVEASAATVTPLSRDDVVAFHDRFFKPNNGLIVMVGDVTLTQAQTEITRAFGDWQSGPVPALFNYPPIHPHHASVVHLVDRPNSEQATLYVGNPSVNARNPARYPLTVVNTILGAGFTGRLNQTLRVEKGYTYGVSCSLDTRTHAAGAFVVSTDVDPNHTGSAVQDILQELQTLRTQPIPAAELQRARGLLTGQFDLSLEQPTTTANHLATYARTGVPLAEVEVYRDQLVAVTATDALDAAATYIAPQPIVVIVGNAALIRPQLDQLGYETERISAYLPP